MNKSKKLIFILSIFILFISLFVRFYALEMDSFSYEGYGTAWFDEGGYVHAAKNKALFNIWALEGDLLKTLYISPLFVYLEFISFSILGVNTFAMRLVPALLGIISIIISSLFLLFKNFKQGIVFFILLSMNVMLIAFNRIAMLESILIFFMLLILGLIIHNKNYSWFLIGFFIPFLFFSKISSLFFILAIPLSLILHFLLYKSRKFLKNFLMVIYGVIISAILWLFWLIPNINNWLGVNFGQVYSSRIGIGITKTIVAALNGLKFFSLNQIIVILSLISIFFTINTLVKRKKISFIDLFLIITLILFFIHIFLADYGLRRFVLLVPILSLVSTRFICKFNNVSVYLKNNSLKISKTFLIIFFLFIYVIINFAYLGIYFNPLFSDSNDNYNVMKTSIEINNYIPEGERVYGNIANALSIENKIKPYFSHNNINYANTEEHILPYLKQEKINYAILENNLFDKEDLNKDKIDLNKSKAYMYVHDNFEIVKSFTIKNTRTNCLNQKIYIYKRKKEQSI